MEGNEELNYGYQDTPCGEDVEWYYVDVDSWYYQGIIVWKRLYDYPKTQWPYSEHPEFTVSPPPAEMPTSYTTEEPYNGACENPVNDCHPETITVTWGGVNLLGYPDQLNYPVRTGETTETIYQYPGQTDPTLQRKVILFPLIYRYAGLASVFHSYLLKRSLSNVSTVTALLLLLFFMLVTSPAAKESKK